MKIFEALNILDKVGMRVSRVDEAGMIFDMDLAKEILKIAKKDDPSVVNVGFVRNHPVLFYKDGWKVGRKVNRRDLVDRFKAGSLTDDEILDILDDCKRNNKLSVETTAQYDWNDWFNGFHEESMERDGLTKNEYVAAWGANEDLPITSRDPIIERKRKRLADLKRAKAFRDETAGRGEIIDFNYDSILDMMIKTGAVRKNSDWFGGLEPGQPYLVPDKGIIKLRQAYKSGGNSNRWYKWEQIPVFKDPQIGNSSRKPYRFEDKTGWLCSKEDLEAACRKIAAMDWMDIKDYPYKKK